MNILNRKFKLLTIATTLGACVAGNAQATPDLSTSPFVTYGDFQSYALQVEGVMVGSTGPGSAFYVNSTPDAIKDLIVVATGASGSDVNTNAPGMDSALSTPNGAGGSNFFSGVWNSTLAAFTTFAGANQIFFFNNNQTTSGSAANEIVAVWERVSLTGAGMTTINFDFTNRDSAYAIAPGGGGVFNGSVAAYTSAGAGPIAGTNAATDYVLSGGAICLNGAIPVSCSQPHTAGPISNNLGANQAAYAEVSPELDAFLDSWLHGFFAGYTAIHVDLRFGCDPLPTVGQRQRV